MDFDKMDPDFFTRMSSYTSRVYRDLYPSIDPTSSKLSQKGKVIVLTGAGGGIGGQGIAPAFARAGARAIVLVGRNESKLEETAGILRKINSAVEVPTIPTDISDPAAVKSLFAKIKEKYGAADVLVNNAGVLMTYGNVGQSDPEKWWTEFTINIRGTYLVTRGFLQLLGNENRGFIINTSSGAATNIVPGMSSYSISKLAVNRLTEYTAAENPNVNCVTLDPGTVSTEMVIESFRKFALDTPELIGGAAVWLATEDAAFLNGRVFMANWSVDQLMEKKADVAAGNDLKMILQGRFGQADKVEK